MKNETDYQVQLDPPAKVLVVDDSKLNRCFIENAFMSPEYIILTASNAKDGISIAEKETPELILMDVMMHDVDGFTATEELKRNPKTKDIPVIFITALDAVSDKLKAFEVGGVDFVTKPFNHRELIARVYTNIALRRTVAEQEELLKSSMQSQKNEAIAKIAAGISHNFNNMLGVTTCNMMLIKSTVGETFSDMANAAYGDVMASLKRMQEMVKQFLILAQRNNEVSSGVPTPVNIGVKTLFAGIKTLPFSKELEVDVQTEAHVSVDPEHIKEIFKLIINEVLEITSNTADCKITITEEDSTIISSIEINNIKIDQKLHHVIFEPFAMPISNVGTGLSFAVAKQIAIVNKVDLTAEFPEEKQLVFKMHLKKIEEL